MRPIHKLIPLLAVTLAFAGCRESSFDKRVNDFPQIELTEHWILGLPSNIHKTTLKDSLYEEVFLFSGDSMILRLSRDSISPQDALGNLRARLRNEKQGIATGPCLGGYTGYAKFHNFLDTSHGLSGTILDLEEDGRKCVVFRIEEFRTGNAIDLAFESISSERQDLIHAIAKSIKFKP